MAFQDIIGHKTVVELLKRALVNQRVSHAYLFVGPEGIGKEYTAVEFARALQCLNNTSDSCGECRSCRKFASGNHPDFQIIRPEENKIGIEAIRDLQKDLVYKPYESDWKIYIIDQAHLMTAEAANSLLKTLEEPPQYVVIILATSQKEAILPTIISRCQMIQFHKLSRDELGMYLNKNELALAGEEELREVILLADGSIGQAERLLADSETWDQRKKLLDFLLSLEKKKNIEIHELLDSLQFGRKLDQWQGLLKTIKTFYRDLLVIKNSADSDMVINLSFYDALHNSATKYSNQELEEVIKLIERTNNFIMANVDPELAVEVMLQKIKARRV